MRDNRLSELKNSLITQYELKCSYNEEIILRDGWIDLSNDVSSIEKFNKELYNTFDSVKIYRNFLNWIFDTFKLEEFQFRLSFWWYQSFWRHNFINF